MCVYVKWRFRNFTTQGKVARMIFMRFSFSHENHAKFIWDSCKPLWPCIHCFPFHIVQHRRPLRYGDQGDLWDGTRSADWRWDRRYPHGFHSTEHYVPLQRVQESLSQLSIQLLWRHPWKCHEAEKGRFQLGCILQTLNELTTYDQNNEYLSITYELIFQLYGLTML